MFSQHHQDSVIEAEFIDERQAPAGVTLSETAARAAAAIESIADVVATVDPHKSARLHERAHQIRVAGSSVQVVVEQGQALLAGAKQTGKTVKEMLAKVGIEPAVIQRPRGRRGVS